MYIAVDNVDRDHQKWLKEYLENTIDISNTDV